MVTKVRDQTVAKGWKMFCSKCSVAILLIIYNKYGSTCNLVHSMIIDSKLK